MFEFSSSINCVTESKTDTTLIYITRKSLEKQCSNTHSNITHTRTPTLEHRYSPSSLTQAQRDRVTKRFERYVNETLILAEEKHNAHAHWSKLEVPKDDKRLEVVRSRVRSRFPVKEFNEARPSLIRTKTIFCAVFLIFQLRVLRH